MAETDEGNGREAKRLRAMGSGAVVFILIAAPLWRELEVPGNTGWNVILALMLIGMVVAGFALQRFFVANLDNIGEARFDTSNRREDGK